MKILNLILYSENDSAYISMRDVLREHTARYPDVRSIFYMYDPTCTEPWVLDGDILRIRGVETYVPGVLNKTIEAFRITAEWPYDLLIRSNISSIVDFTELQKYCSDPRFEFGGQQSTIRWIDPRGGIFDGRFHNMNYVAGWCMVFSRTTIQLLLSEPQFIDTSIIDDVAISDFLLRKRQKENVILNNLCSENTLDYNPSCCMFRNLTYANRFEDVERMRVIASRMHPSHP